MGEHDLHGNCWISTDRHDDDRSDDHRHPDPAPTQASRPRPDVGRPEKPYGKGPDNRWTLAGDRHAVVEMKTGCTTATIAKKDVDRLRGPVRWD